MTRHFRLSLRQLLWAVSLIALAFGLIAAAHGQRELGPVTVCATTGGVVALGLGLGILVGHPGAVTVFLAVLAAVSLATSEIEWIGGYPYGEVRIHLVDEAGRPVEGATFDVPDASPEMISRGKPFEEFKRQTALRSDEDGMIVCHQVKEISNFGGREYWLFWCIPIGDQGPDCLCRIAHPGFRRATFSFWRLFEHKYTDYEDLPKTTCVDAEGRSHEMPVYSHTLTLNRK